MKRNQKGFSALEAVVILLIVGVVGLVGWKVFVSQQKTTDSTDKNSTATSKSSALVNEPEALMWQQTSEGWRATQTAPACGEQPLLKSPVDMSKVTSMLYPGQKRGGNYKPHGGYRFDTVSDNKVTVTAPISGYVVRGARYIAEGEGEIQYTFDLMNNCGVMIRLGHLRELTSDFQKIVDTFPAATQSSATTNVNPAVYVKQGTTIATKVGIINSQNTFFDFGVYDFRQENEASKSAVYQSAHPQKELDWHAVCWFKDWLPAKDTAKIASLPAGDPASGKSSDYCK